MRSDETVGWIQRTTDTRQVKVVYCSPFRYELIEGEQSVVLRVRYNLTLHVLSKQHILSSS